MGLTLQEVETRIRERVESSETAAAVRAGARATEREPAGELFNASVVFTLREVEECGNFDALMDAKLRNLVRISQKHMHPDYFVENPKGGFHHKATDKQNGVLGVGFEWWPV